MSKPTYRVVLEALPDAVPHACRMRRLLKMALRSFGFRATAFEELPPVTPAATPGRPPAGEQAEQRPSGQ
jgi:hypothetical protein